MEEIQRSSIASSTSKYAIPAQANRSGNSTIANGFPELGTELTGEVARVLTRFSDWLSGYGETSWDHQSFFAGPVGGRAKSLYYRQGSLGVAAVAPIIFCEAFLPSARRLFHHPIRFPIADAHYAMGFAFMYEVTGTSVYLDKAVHFWRN